MGDLQHLGDVLILLLALLVAVPLFQRLRLGSVLAYLIAGVVIGPSALGVISDIEATRPFAELGVVFLLFTVGLEVSFARLRLFGRGVYGLAVMQVVATTVILAGAGWAAGLQPVAALAIGGALTFSSTAVVLQLLSERSQLGTPLGRTAIAILLLQDLAVPLWIVFVSGVTDPPASLSLALGLSGLKFALFVVAMWFVQRRGLKPLLRLAVGSEAPEVFMAATLLIVLGIGWLTEVIGLSMALGAFIAGMLVADTEFRHQVAADIQPFRGLLLGLFFMTVGMGLDLEAVLTNAGQITAIVVAVMVLKAAIIVGLAVFVGLPRQRALALGALLSQVSEFAFVLLALAMQWRLLPVELGQLLTAVAGVSMAVTALGAVVADRLLPSASKTGPGPFGKLQEEAEGLAGHVVIAGFGQVGMAVARFLAGERVPVLVLDLMPKRVSQSRLRGLRVFYGNAARIDVLRAAHLDRAHALVVAVPDPLVGEQITLIARRSFPQLPIFVRVPDETWISRLRAAGAGAVVLEGLTTALDLAERVMLVYDPQREYKT